MTRLVKILNRDSKTAGIPNIADRVRTIDMHALRHAFGPLFSRPA